jgi:hypothetical protein|nr:MAG TPA: protein of unknown function DUF3310 [Caudoviricetes sp.]
MNNDIINHWYCKSEVHYKHLMKKLEERGWKWWNGDLPTQHELYNRPYYGIGYYSEPIIISGDANRILQYTAGPRDEAFRNLKDIAIKVELPKPKVVRETETVQSFLNRKDVNGRELEFELSHVSTLAGAIAQSIADGDNTIKPSHYQSGSGDLFDDWFNRYDLATFRALMYGTAERYFRRYPDKNGKEDFKKGQEVLRRLEEYEAKAGEVTGWRK